MAAARDAAARAAAADPLASEAYTFDAGNALTMPVLVTAPDSGHAAARAMRLARSAIGGLRPGRDVCEGRVGARLTTLIPLGHEPA
jgi:hypothetical protein